ncbi:MAG: cell division protein ZapA [Chryseobacterium sp.]|nr:MAG: cell division protein ZapA [Chryseobacterium sp.]
MDFRRITINIAGRTYPLNVPAAEEETLRKVGKQIEEMIKDFETNFAVKDKQDALAMCALRLGTNAEINRLTDERNIKNTNDRLLQLGKMLTEHSSGR